MKNIENTIKKATLLLGCMFSSFLSALADDLQNSLNNDYLRTPEASAFMKYGEESVSEYTGTADISVPLYTIKCKDIEIPITLQYDASGIKVEQEASWVGLGWNLMVGGCINYVCAGGHDMYGAPNIGNDVWTEYLTSEIDHSLPAFGKQDRVIKSQTRYYRYHDGDKFNWMNRFPLRPQNFILSYVDYLGGGMGMKEYVDWGWGERDFYSVNILGKSFMFFIDPFTLNVYNIGKAGENFKVERDYQSEVGSGIAHQKDVYSWKITDSDGYIYHFTEGDKYQWEPRTGSFYTSCWYLTKIKSPMGEEVEFKYQSHTKPGRTTKVESYKIPFFGNTHAMCCSDACNQIKGYNFYFQSDNSNMYVTSHYLSEINTSNQTVTFDMSDSNECSGKRLNTIKVKSNDGTVIKNIQFSYSSFTPSNVGGNYAPQDTKGEAQNRLKLDNVKEVTSSDILTTSFSYNPKQLPSKRSCAQDFWGYYNGKENKLTETIYTLIPTPTEFMSFNYNQKLSDYLQGADRYSSSECMQACMLTRIDYPTGGYTTYEYESNSIYTDNFKLSDIYREKQYDISIQEIYSAYPTSSGMEETPRTKFFSLYKDATVYLSLQCSGDRKIYGDKIIMEIRKLNRQTSNYELYADTTTTFPLPYTKKLSLTAGDYLIGLSLITSNKNIPFSIVCDLNGWYNRTMSSGMHQLTVGGLRIKRICNYNDDKSLINKTFYDYDGSALLNKIETIDYSNCYNMNPVGNIPGTHTVDVYTITPGHPRLPAFYASCCSGVVGYSKVTKSKFNAKNKLEKRVVTSYRNSSPETMYFIDFFRCFDNGLIESQEVYDASNAIIAKTVNTYERDIVDHYATNIVTKYKCLNQGTASPAASLTLNVYDFPNCYPTETREMSMSNSDAVADVWRYPYILSRVNLTKTETTEYAPNGSTIVKTKSYCYNERNHQLSRIDETTSHTNQTRRTEFVYSADSTDDTSIAMSSIHRLNDVIETRNILVDNGHEKRVSTRHTHYAQYGPNSSPDFLPCAYSTSIGNHPLDIRATYSYDARNNVCSIIVDGMETVYIWSYNGQYPIAKIEGLTLAKVKEVIGETTITKLLGEAAPSEIEFNSLRDAIANAGGHITTYTYQPLVGITSETQPNGNSLHYKYDGFGRLTESCDVNGNTLQKYHYNYRKK